MNSSIPMKKGMLMAFLLIFSTGVVAACNVGWFVIIHMNPMARRHRRKNRILMLQLTRIPPP